MLVYPLAAFGGVVAIALVAWGIRSHREKQEARRAEMERLGFHPCPDRKSWLEETITAIERNKGYRYEVRDPRRLAGDTPIYLYTKVRHDHPDDDAYAEEEILFPLKRSSPAGVVLVVKPSSVGPGLASRMMGAVATGPWDTQPDDLERLDVPLDLKNTNLVGIMAPSGARLYDLVDSRMLGVVQRLGDVGGMCMRCRDEWCAIASVGREIPFRLRELVALVRPLL